MEVFFFWVKIAGLNLCLLVKKKKNRSRSLKPRHVYFISYYKKANIIFSIAKMAYIQKLFKQKQEIFILTVRRTDSSRESISTWDSIASLALLFLKELEVFPPALLLLSIFWSPPASEISTWDWNMYIYTFFKEEEKTSHHWNFK